MPWWAPNANTATSVSAVVWDLFGQGSLKTVGHEFFSSVWIYFRFRFLFQMIINQNIIFPTFSVKIASFILL